MDNVINKINLIVLWCRYKNKREMLSKEKSVVRVSFFKAQLNTHTQIGQITRQFSVLAWNGVVTTKRWVLFTRYLLSLLLMANIFSSPSALFGIQTNSTFKIQYDCKAIETIDVWCCVNFVGCGLLGHINQTMWATTY